ncbi:MAG TPA: phytanoyl-CoA dioxygenase family protein [Streptosporangiaceae bacterium]
MDASLARGYAERGYAAVPGFLPPGLLRDLRAVTDTLLERATGLTESDSRFDLEPGHSARTPMVRRINDPVTAHPLFAEVMRSSPLLDLVGGLIGPGIRFQGNKLNTKSGDGGSAVEWHQDFAFYPHTNDDLLAVGIALDDSVLATGCLLAIPGSHRGPVLDHHHDGVFAGAISPARSGIDLAAAVPLEVPAGGISVHHVKLVHGSAPNRSGRQRRLLLFQYAAADAWPLLPLAGLDAFNAAMVRGKPAARFRMTADTVRIPLPEPASVRSIFEIQESARERPLAGS